MLRFYTRHRDLIEAAAGTLACALLIGAAYF